MRKITPMKAIRHKCLDCQNNHYSFVKNCDSTDCPLYPYRLGHRPRLRGSDSKVTLSQKVAS